jgi:tungstate transport system substrate-binding protein
MDTVLFIILALALTLSATAAEPAPVRCAVIGGMTMTGLWPAVSKMFEAETRYRVEVVATGQRPILDAALRQGKVDLLTMHSGDSPPTW